MSTARQIGLAALAAKVVLGASLALGFGSLPVGIAHAADPLGAIGADAQAQTSGQAPDPGIVTDGTGQLRDCTVTDASGQRADWDTSCNEYWSASRSQTDDAERSDSVASV